MSKFYLLDRNIVSVIKDAVDAKPQRTNDKTMMLKKLRGIDRRTNFISTMLSVREGQIGKHESEEETKRTIDKEADYLASFYKNAKVDSAIIKNNKELVSDVFSGNLEIYWEKYESFLKFSNEFLFQPISKKEKPRRLEEIISYADKLGLSKGHPVFISVLSCFYGSPISRAVIKPKKAKPNFYNEISDLVVLTRVNRVKLNIFNRNPKIKVEFLTLDKKLSKFLDCINVISIGEIKEGELLTTSSYSSSLFPELKKQEYFSLMERLGANL
ncbi:hypothetical protein EBM84_24435 [Vibrio parahaemolyticus]|nr:hypothetical protein [Vibrio parahaemolyticus]